MSYNTRDESDELMKNIFYAKLDLSKMCIEDDLQIILNDTDNEIFYENSINSDPVVLTSNGLPYTPGDFNATQIELFGKPLTRDGNVETQAWCEKYITWIKVKTLNGMKSLGIHKKLAEPVKRVLEKLTDMGFNIYQLGGYYWRPINNPSHPNSKKLSYHSYGVAIDINWAENWFVKGGKPKETGDSTTSIKTLNSPVVQELAKIGFGWGGRYGDYMHFSVFNGG